MERTKNIYPPAVPWLEQGKPLALATIVETKGSTPQIPGASALFSEQGLVLGTLGGGILEAGAQEKALRCLRSGRSLFYEFRLRGGAIGREEALCGGSASILVDAVPGDHLRIFKKLRAAIRGRRSGVLVTRIRCGRGKDAKIERVWLEEGRRETFRLGERWALSRAEIDEARREGRPRLVAYRKGADEEKTCQAEGGGKSKNLKTENTKTLFFLEPLSPLPRLVIAGAGHIGRAVAHLGHLLDFEVTVIDDRAEFANRARFPEADQIIVRDVGRALAGFPISDETYIVIVTRGHQNDARALRACIRSPAAYIGLIGSRRKIALMREEFIARGWATVQELDRLHAPIGLPIGSKTVEEIAVSIASELIQVRSGRAEDRARREG